MIARARPLVIAARLLMLLLAAGAVVAAVEMTGRLAAVDEAAHYVCPMHADVRASVPGECPICGMALEPATRDTGARLRGPEIADLEAVENVRRHNIVDFVRLRSLLPNLRELRGPAWVDASGVVTALFYEDQITALSPNERGTFSPSDAPARAVAVRRTADRVDPWDRSTSQVRFRLEAGRDGLAPGTVGWLSLPPRPRQVLTVAASALRQSPEGPYVLVSTGGFRFARRRIEIGETFLKQGFAVVLSGLRVNDRVVARATFFLDAERRLDTAAP